MFHLKHVALGECFGRLDCNDLVVGNQGQVFQKLRTVQDILGQILDLVVKIQN